MRKKTSIEHDIPMRETDFSFNLTLKNIGEWFLNVAALDSERKGFGMQVLQQKGYAWVALRILINVKKYPVAFEKIKITTWIQNWSKLTTQRNCIIQNARGETLVEISSIFALINFNTRQVVNMQDALVDMKYERYICDKGLSIRSPEKIHALSNEELVDTRKVVYSNIDCNLHVSSFEYVSWILDTFSLEVFKNKKISEFEINYIKECKLGETVTIHREQLNENEYVFDIRNQEGTTLNRCKVTF